MSAWPKTTTVYLHGCEETMGEKGIKLGLTEEALNRFYYCCYEMAFTIEVNEDGTAFVTHVDDVPLNEKLLVS
jgi:hypothetical protein